MLASSFVVAIIHITQMFRGHFYLSQVLEIIIPLLLSVKSFLGTAALICNHGCRQYNPIIFHHISWCIRFSTFTRAILLEQTLFFSVIGNNCETVPIACQSGCCENGQSHLPLHSQCKFSQFFALWSATTTVALTWTRTLGKLFLKQHFFLAGNHSRAQDCHFHTCNVFIVQTFE